VSPPGQRSFGVTYEVAIKRFCGRSLLTRHEGRGITENSESRAKSAGNEAAWRG